MYVKFNLPGGGGFFYDMFDRAELDEPSITQSEMYKGNVTGVLLDSEVHGYVYSGSREPMIFRYLIW
ncbi:hypothetical protein SCA6_006666 [Theobroma cacao]